MAFTPKNPSVDVYSVGEIAQAIESKDTRALIGDLAADGGGPLLGQQRRRHQQETSNCQ